MYISVLMESNGSSYGSTEVTEKHDVQLVADSDDPSRLGTYCTPLLFVIIQPASNTYMHTYINCSI